jgi:hypothetical protein
LKSRRLKKTGSFHDWQISKAHSTLQIACGFQNPLQEWLYYKIMQAAITIRMTS